MYTESDLTLDEDKPKQYTCIFARLSHWKHLPQGDIKEYDWDPEKYKKTEEDTEAEDGASFVRHIDCEDVIGNEFDETK